MTPTIGAGDAVKDDARAALLNIQHEIEQAVIVREGGRSGHARIQNRPPLIFLLMLSSPRR